MQCIIKNKYKLKTISNRILKKFKYVFNNNK